MNGIFKISSDGPHAICVCDRCKKNGRSVVCFSDVSLYSMLRNVLNLLESISSASDRSREASSI